MQATAIIVSSVLGTIFLACTLVLLWVCYQRYSKRKALQKLFQHSDTEVKSDDELVGFPESGPISSIEDVLQDDLWAENAGSLIGHCMSVVKGCHSLTEKMVTMAADETDKMESSDELVTEAARGVTPLADDVVRAMYPPLDPRLLETRCIALVQSVTGLVLVVKSACGQHRQHSWLDVELQTVEEHLQELRSESKQYVEQSLNSGDDVAASPLSSGHQLMSVELNSGVGLSPGSGSGAGPGPSSSSSGSGSSSSATSEASCSSSCSESTNCHTSGHPSTSVSAAFLNRAFDQDD